MNNETLGIAPRPIIKWAGGKAKLAKTLLEGCPDFNAYHEPFIGGGAVFFEVQPKSGSISDTNARLISLYQVIRDQPEALRKKHRKMVDAFNASDEEERKAIYGEARDRFNQPRVGSLESAALFLFLNRAGFNGLFRENANGSFNVPFGNPRILSVLDPENLLRVSEALANIEILKASFDSVLDRAAPRDLVYFDPPYVPLSPTASFTAYSAAGFGLAQQEQLAAVVRELTSRGVYVIASNSYTPLVKDLYKGLNISQIAVRRMIGASAASRGTVAEAVIRNF